MRIYEVARQYKKSSKELIALLEKKGFSPKSHMAVLSDKEMAVLEQAFRGTKEMSVQQQQTRKPKTSKPAPRKKEKVTFAKKFIEKPVATVAPVVEGIVAEAMPVGEVSALLGKDATEVILQLLRWGTMAAKNQVISKELVERLAQTYNIPVLKPAQTMSTVDLQEFKVDEKQLAERLPVVVVLGHVDHGKTSLLDYIRKEKVAEKEKGGITQHIGAYEATTDHGNLIFIDTPGHEAFSKIRQRGARVADIAILIIAADDGIMPQTVEAIKHIKEAKIPLVVAINKIDKADPSRIEVVRRQLSEHDLLPEEWGGDIVTMPISVKEGRGISELLEMLVLQTQMLELRAQVDGPGKGYVLESKLEKGRGPVATVIGKHGSITVGDYFTCGTETGRVTALVDSYGKTRTSIGPSVPIRVAGFDAMPGVGDYFQVVDKADYRKAKSARVYKRETGPRVAENAESINIIVKTDTHSSLEALLDSIEKLSHTVPVGFNVISSGVGAINETDVELAYTAGAHIFGLHIKADSKSSVLARRRGVTITSFGIIYKLLEHLEEYSESKRQREVVYTKTGEAVVLQVFKIKGVGVIAGCRVTDGKFIRGGKVTVWRGNAQVGEGKIKSLQREKRAAKEVAAGFECGFSVDGFEDFAVDDRIECFSESLV